MTTRRRQFVGIGMSLALILAIEFPAFGQTSVVVEIKVLEASRMDIDRLQASPLGTVFASKLSREAVQPLADSPRSKTVHRLELQASSGQSTQFRVDSRIPSTSASAAESPSYLDIGIGMDLVPKVFQNRDISLATTSQVRIRRSPDAEGRMLTVFENPSVGNETRIHEGESIILGGFITDQERAMLPSIPVLPDNPVLNYLFARKRDSKEKVEIIVLLTPRIIGAVVNPAVDSPPRVPVPKVVESQPPASVAPKPPAAKAKGPVYSVQVGAFESSAKAEALVAQLAKKYEAVFIDKVATGKTPYHVRVGRFPEMKAARELQAQLARDGFDTFVATMD